ncbi:hypothetical protein [Streptomyces sp. NBC_00334]|uniref:hypothetical protein n=1 Tax=Streptomyces sp. NBC_00334 TaxID=2975713 RepID=UPI002E2BA83D|nr:hypothetical protein [Streptomyces sp. NBC_00334]
MPPSGRVLVRRVGVASPGEDDSDAALERMAQLNALLDTAREYRETLRTAAHG